MLDKRHKGIEISKANTVTQTEVTIKGQKPNWLSEGYQSSENINSLNLCVLNKGIDLNTSPAPIANGSNRQNVIQVIIHLDEILSVNFLVRIIGGFFKLNPVAFMIAGNTKA